MWKCHIRKAFPMDSIISDETVFIVDYSISPDEMRQLLTITKNVIWIDHHKTAIDKYKDFEFDILGIRADGTAACMLTYLYFQHLNKSWKMDQDAVPMSIQLIADWDVWKFEFGDDTRYFMVAFNSYDFHPKSTNWNWLTATADDNDGVEPYLAFIEDGKTMRIFRDGWARDYMSLGFEVEFEGYRCFALNLGRCNSEYFKSVKEKQYDILMAFVFDGSQYSVSLYSTEVDVSEIAKKYGGGGHKKASGFQCKELLFKKQGG